MEYLEERVWEDDSGLVQKIVSLGSPFLKLVQKMAEFMLKLLVRKRKKGELFRRGNFLKVEVVASLNGFVMDGFQVGVYGLNGIFRFPEADELGMVRIAFRLAQQDFPGEQAFPPQGNQADGVQIGRMKGPKSHDFLDCERPYSVDFSCAAGKRP